RHNFGNPLCALLTDSVGYVVFAIILCKVFHDSLVGNFQRVGRWPADTARSRSASHRMEPTDAERHRWGGRASESDALQDPVRVAGRLCQTPPLTSILGNSGFGLPRRCVSGKPPHSASDHLYWSAILTW